MQAIKEFWFFGFVYFDLKPQNILIDVMENVKLIDFDGCYFVDFFLEN